MIDAIQDANRMSTKQLVKKRLVEQPLVRMYRPQTLRHTMLSGKETSTFPETVVIYYLCRDLCK